MSSSNNLFELIKSMTSSEKRFFKLSTQKHTKDDDQIYIKLFDVIDKQEVYNESLILWAFKNEYFIKRLASEKHNLYHILLKCLSEFNNKSSVHQTLYTSLQNARILHDKLLFKQALKLVSSAKEKAIKYNKHFILLELIDIEIACINSLMDFDLLSDKLPYLQIEIEVAINTISKTSSYIKYYSQFIIETKTYFNVRSDEQSERLDDIYRNLLKENGETPLNSDDFFRLQSLLSYYHMSKSEFNDSQKVTRKLLEYIEKDSDFTKLYPERHLNTLYNYMMLCDLNRLYPEALKNYDKAISFQEKYKVKETPLMNFIKLRFYVYRLNQTIRHGEFNDGITMLNELEKKNGLLNDLIDVELTMSFHYNAAYLYFLKENFKKALKHINHIINLPESESRLDIKCFARILNLFIHYELGNSDTLYYALRNTHNYLNKKNAFFKTENLIFKFFTNFLKSSSLPQKQFVSFKESLEHIFSDPSEVKTLDYFDLLSWTESKISGEEFIEVVKRKKKKEI